jgi:hypothetical protein
MAEQVYGFVYDSLSKAAARGVLAPTDPHGDTLALIAAVHGVIELHKSGVMDRRDAEAAGERLVALLLDGLTPERPQAERRDA